MLSLKSCDARNIRAQVCKLFSSKCWSILLALATSSQWHRSPSVISSVVCFLGCFLYVWFIWDTRSQEPLCRQLNDGSQTFIERFIVFEQVSTTDRSKKKLWLIPTQSFPPLPILLHVCARVLRLYNVSHYVEVRKNTELEVSCISSNRYSLSLCLSLSLSHTHTHARTHALTHTQSTHPGSGVSRMQKSWSPL